VDTRAPLSNQYWASFFTCADDLWIVRLFVEALFWAKRFSGEPKKRKAVKKQLVKMVIAGDDFM
jgi:hypothetical protein